MLDSDPAAGATPRADTRPPAGPAGASAARATDSGAAAVEGEPRVVTSTGVLEPAVGAEGVTGAIWRLPDDDRGLDTNVIQLPPHGAIDPHLGPALDVLWHVVAGSGTLTTASGTTALGPGDVVHLPRESLRGVQAGKKGLRYLTVHARKPGLGLGPTRG